MNDPKPTENNINITLFAFRLNSVFTTDTFFGQILPLMFFIFNMQQKWTWIISNNYIIKSAESIKLKYIWISLDIYQRISYHAQNKKNMEENNLSTTKTYQMSNKWQYLTCIKVSFSNQNLQNAIVRPRLPCQWQLHNYT